MSAVDKRVFRLLFAPIFLAVFPTACEKAPSQAVQPVPVEVAQAESADVPLKIRSIGTVEPIQKVAISSQVSGYLQGTFFAEGQDIKEGQPLFKIDPRKFEAARMQSEAALEQAEVQLKNAQQEVRRSEPLVKQQMISSQEYDRLQAEANQLQAAVKVQKALLKAAALDLAFCTIHAPISGRAGSLMVHKGDLIKVNDTVLVTINQINPIRVKFAIPEKDLGAVRSAWAVGPVPVSASLSKGSKELSVGKLASVDNAVDVPTGSIMLKAEFINDGEILWPGQYVDVEAILSTVKGAVVIPSKAVQTGQQGTFVFVVDAQQKAGLRKVVLGQAYEENAVVQDGLKVGETVVVDGQVRLGDGTPVNVRKASESTQEKSR